MALSSKAANQQYMSLAKTLPEKLQRFLARYPAPQVLSVGAPKTQTGYQTDTRNPFRPHFHQATRRWHNPVYSARRQADLVKLARAHGVEELLPSTTKNTETRLAKKVALGSRIKGTGVGQRVKGRIHERMLAVKYVLVRDGGGVASESCARWTFADVVVQNGQEERGHAQDAGTHQRVESSKFQLGVLVGLRSSANGYYRLEGRTGPSGRNKGSHSYDGLSITVQLYIERVHQNHNIHVKHTMPGTRTVIRISLQLTYETRLPVRLIPTMGAGSCYTPLQRAWSSPTRGVSFAAMPPRALPLVSLLASNRQHNFDASEMASKYQVST